MKAAKFLACLLSLAMLFGAMPFGVTAADNTRFLQYNVTSKNEATIMGFTSTASVLDIPSELNGYPVTSIYEFAFAYNNTLKNVTVPDSVTSIGRYAFSECRALTEFVIPSGITSIKDCTFSFCSAMKSITIPDSVKSIGTEAFGCCFALTEIILPDSITSIGAYTFSYCTGLTDIYIPAGVETMGTRVFADCTAMTDIYCAAPSKPDGWDDGWLGNCKATVHWNYTPEEEEPFEFTYNVTDGAVTVTGYNGEGGEVVIPSEIEGLPVTAIGKMAFLEQRAITSVVIPAGVTSIGDGAFGICEALEKVILPDGLASIGNGAFASCTTLTSITVPESVTDMGENVFSFCGALTDIYCGASAKPDGWNANWNADCSAEVHWTVVIVETDPSNFTYEIADGAVTITGYIGTDTDVVIPRMIEGYPVTTLGDAAFNAKLIHSIVVQEGVTSIGSGTFFNCSLLDSVTLPESLESIGESAFGLSALQSIVLPMGLKTIGKNAFAQCSRLTSVEIPQSVTTIAAYAFFYCKALQSITIPAGVTTMGTSVFDGCKALTDVYCGVSARPDSWHYQWLGNVFPTVHWYTEEAEESANEFVYYHDDKYGGVIITDYIGEGGDVVIPSTIEGNTVIWIDEKAFSHNKTITSVVIHEGVKTIHAYAFAGCTNMTSISLPSTLEGIDEGAFSDCTSLTAVTIPRNVQIVGPYIFAGCSSLAEINCEASAPTDYWYKEWADKCSAVIYWGGCKHIETTKTEITVEPTCTEDGMRYLLCDGCGNSVEVLEILPATGHSGGENETCTVCGSNVNYTYYYDDKYGGVIIQKYTGAGGDVVIPSMIEGNPVIWIEVKAFSHNQTITSVVIPEGVETIYEAAFAGCVNMTSISLPCTLKRIDSFAFSDCTSLTEVTIPKNIQIVGPYIFAGCSSLAVINCETDAPTDYWYAEWADKCDATVNWGVKSESEPVYGDCNDDGVINGKDVTRLLRYLAHYDSASDAPVVEITEGADCNGDGVINGKDVVRLLRYIASYDEETGYSDVVLGK